MYVLCILQAFIRTALFQVQITCCTNIFSITTHFDQTLQCSQYTYTAARFGAALHSSGERGKSLFALH